MSHYYPHDFEKEAAHPFWKLIQGAGTAAGSAALNFGKKLVAPGVAGFRASKATGQSTARAAGRALAEQAKATGKVVGKGVEAVKNSPRAQAVGRSVADATAPVSDRVGRLGQYTTDVSRNVLNFGEELANRARGKPQMYGPGGLGDRMISPTAQNPRSLRNVAVGSGVLYGGARATGLTGGGSPADSVYTPVAPGAAMPTPMPNYQSGGGGFLSGIPKEMQYAAMAGVPMALLGAYMGGGKGLGMGALGLGALGLGAAGSGYFGDDARRMVGQGASSLMGLFGGNQNGDVMSQIEQLSSLSPEFGVTMLMGKNPGLSREEAEQMYQFLTQNKGTIAKMVPMVTGAQTPMAKAGALMAISAELDKTARCWKGYEPVPGKKPYSNNSCRPSGSGKKKMKKSAHDLEKDAFLGAVARGVGSAALGAGKSLVKNLPAAASGIASGSRRAVTAMGDAASFAGKQLARGGQAVNQAGNTVSQAAGVVARHAGDTAAQPTLNTLQRGVSHVVGGAASGVGAGGSAVAAGGSLANRLGQGINLAGRGLQAAGKHTATAVPLAAAGAYGAYQAARPMLPAVNFRSPVADPGRAPTFQSPVTIGAE